MKSAQPKPFATINDQETLQLLTDNIANLEYRMPGSSMILKHPYFQEQLSGNREGVKEIKRRFCEAIVQLLEKHDRLKNA